MAMKRQTVREPRNAKLEAGMASNPYANGGLRGRQYLERLTKLPPEERPAVLAAIPEPQRGFCELSMRHWDQQQLHYWVAKLDVTDSLSTRQHMLAELVPEWLRSDVSRLYQARWEKRRRSRGRR
jgi:hypothetical protein